MSENGINRSRSVCAHKRWLFISSTLIKQTVRSSLIKGEYDSNHVYIIDGAVTARESNPKHQELVREVMTLPSIKVVEHPDLFVNRVIIAWMILIILLN